MKKNKNVKKGVIIGLLACALILVGFLGSYAYFIGQLGQNKNQEVKVQTGTMELIFSDGTNGFNRELDFGESAEKTFTIENTGTKDGVVSVSWMNLLNTYLEGSMTYTFLESDTEDGEFTEIVSNKNIPVSKETKDKGLVSGIKIPAGVKKYYKLIITLNYTDFDQTEDLNAKLETQFKITEGILKDPTPTEKTLAKLNKTVKEDIPNFAATATSDETADGLYAMEDDYGTSYYYRGATEDNYVKFAGFYWRIIRINGDGSLRVIYNGTQAHVNGSSSADRLVQIDQIYNSGINDAKYAGYMFSPENGPSTNKEEAQTNTVNSDIKTATENWYKTNIADKGYDEFVSDNIFCNDRTTPGKEATGWSDDTGLGYGTNKTGYGVTARSNVWNTDVNKVQPKFTCDQKNDAFTKEDTERGNGKLGEKVGLITADEVVAGGGNYETTNNSYYLYNGALYLFWTLSPCSLIGSSPTIFTINDGRLEAFTATSMIGIAPVISLSADYVNTLIGDGTMTNPFRENGIDA